jgi:hypothetical protein
LSAFAMGRHNTSQESLWCAGMSFFTYSSARFSLAKVGNELFSQIFTVMVSAMRRSASVNRTTWFAVCRKPSAASWENKSPSREKLLAEYLFYRFRVLIPLFICRPKILESSARTGSLMTSSDMCAKSLRLRDCNHWRMNGGLVNLHFLCWEQAAGPIQIQSCISPVLELWTLSKVGQQKLETSECS